MAVIPSSASSSPCYTIAPIIRSASLIINGLIGLSTAGLALSVASPWVALGIPASALAHLIIVMRAMTDEVIVGETAVTVRQGLLRANTSILPLERLHVRVRQGLIGRAMNFGTVWLSDGNLTIRVAHLGEARELIAVLHNRVGASLVMLNNRGRWP